MKFKGTLTQKQIDELIKQGKINFFDVENIPIIRLPPPKKDTD